MSTRVKLVALLAIPVIALVAVAFAFGIGNSTIDAPKVEAQTPLMSLDLKSGDKACPAGDTADFCASVGGALVISVSIDALPKADGYLTVQSFVSHGALVYKGTDPALDITLAKLQSIIGPQPIKALLGCGVVLSNVGAGNVSTSCTGGTLQGTIVDTFVGQYVNHDFNCTTADDTVTVTLVALGDPPAAGSGTGFVHSDGVTQTGVGPQSFTIHCLVQPTDTPTQTPTETSTATPTNTAVSQPPFVKSPSLQNLWLTRQTTTKIPPVQCVGPQGSTDTAELAMSLGVPIAALDPKGSGKVVDLGAFEFEVHYDAQKVCVQISQAQASITMTCFIQDDVTKPVLEGVARIGCVTVGKKINVDGIWNFKISGLAGLLSAQCNNLVQEAPIFAGLPFKGALVVTGLIPSLDKVPGTPGIQSCTGSVANFGFFVVPSPLSGFNNQTGAVVNGIIPCDAPFLGTACFGPGSVQGTFSQEPTTLDVVFNGTFEAKPILGGNDVTISDGVIVASRKSRLALDLATVIVRPQPDVYSQAIPAQDNGVVVQLNNQKCEIADAQGHPIEIFSCGDADVTIRYLEGDVEPDCKVNTSDTMSIAFRWGASKGTLLYLDRFNLEPFGTQRDDDIDIKDLQAVYGRFGSTCANPHPDQPAVNAKGALDLGP